MIGRIPILDVQPSVNCGQRPAKAVVGETFEVSATIFREGHGLIGAAAVLRDPQGRAKKPRPMTEHEGTDRWIADLTVGEHEGLWRFHVEAWADPIATWHHDAAIKVPRGQDVDLMLDEGALLFDRAARNIHVKAGSTRMQKAKRNLQQAARSLRDRSLSPWDRLAAAEMAEVIETLKDWPLRELVTRSRQHPVRADRERALYGAWYEFFPRSEGVQIDPMGRREPVSGTFRTASARLSAIKDMGFDVVYLPPVHPIGTTFRKGRNNTLLAQPGDPGSPWAIGSQDGGHDAIHPDLGTMDDFDAFVQNVRANGMEVALDLALQASPDHPWAKEHPEWFTTRADGSIAYAENPPKKYQDIYPLNFDNDPEGIYREVKRIVSQWIDHGVRIFRVDNPHTKPLRFWERLLSEIRQEDEDVLFLAEAFTRPAMMATLGMIGFHQSYTYFTWRNTAEELTEYLTELSTTAAAYMRPNFFVNTPDILHEYLQHGGMPAFRIRAVLASMLSPTWGVYSGYELGENVPIRPGSEEYLDSEKYQFKPRDWSSPNSIAPFIKRLNEIRNAHPALHWLRNLTFHRVDRPELLCFSKREGTIGGEPGADEQDTVVVVVNLDPHHTREATVWLDLPALGINDDAGFTVTDELNDSRPEYRWGPANYVRLDPAVQPAHIFRVSRDQSTTRLRLKLAKEIP